MRVEKCGWVPWHRCAATQTRLSTYLGLVSDKATFAFVKGLKSSQWPVSQLLSDFVRLIQSTKFPNPFNDQILPHLWHLTNLKTVATCTDAALAREESIIVGSSSHLWVITRDPGDPGAQKLIITSSHSSPSFFCLVLCPAPLCRAHREEVRVGLAATSLHPSTRLFLNFATLCFTSHTPSCPCHLTQDEPNSYLPK